MADVPELHLVTNRCGGMTLVHEGRAYKLKRADKHKYWRCSKVCAECTACVPKGCGSAVWTDLEVPAGIDQKDHVETCRALLKKRSAEKTKLIPAVYDEEVSAASAEPSTSGQFPVFKRVRATMYKNQFVMIW
ncbi:putative polyketide synthase, type I [Trichinella spiralis]|uniref:putative polyketide synthase, type I n=1 Tax=Trichinella spiralis TaxID=6334 RepID=UPI0001EFC444|nr:putative polyketide synthase, type I [Trichinella spiralis]